MDIKKALSILDGIHEGTKFSFAGEPKQKAGDQVRGTDKAKSKKSGAHPFANRLVGAAESILKDLDRQVVEGSVERKLKQEFAKFDEAYDHNFHAKPFARRGPDVSGEEDPQGDFRVVKKQGNQWVDMKQHYNSNDAFRHAGAIKAKYPTMTIGVKWPNGSVNLVGDAYIPQSTAEADKSMYFFNLRTITGSFTDQDLRTMGLRQSQNGSWFYKPQPGASQELVDKTVAGLEQKLGARAKKWMPPVREYTELELAVMEGGHELQTDNLNEFAPPSDGSGGDEDVLRKLAAQWWNGTEQQMAQAQRTLEMMGWEIGPDESGDEDAGVYVYRIGDEDGRDTIAFGHSELDLNEGVNNVGATVKQLYSQIYNLGDDAVDHLYHNAPVFAQYWDQYEGDIDSLVTELSPKTLTRIAQELQAAAADEGLAEGNNKFNRMMHNITKPDALNTREAVAMISDLIYQGGATYKEALEQAGTSFEIDPMRLHEIYQKQIKSLGEDEEHLPPPENAQRTQIPGTLPTYKKARAHLDTHSPTGKTIDIGSGLGLGAAELGADSYEPYPKKDVKPTYTDFTSIPDNAYHRVTNFNVLNVVPPKLRQEIVQNIGRILAPGGVALITTRGKDVLSALKNGKPGPEPMSVITSAGTYQKGFTTKELIGYVEQVLGGSYDVLPLQKMGQAGVIIRKHPEGKTPRKIKEYGMTTGGTANPTAQQNTTQAPANDPKAAQATQAQKANLNKIAGADKSINVAQASHAIQGIAADPSKPMASTDVKQTKALTDLVGDTLADPQKGGQLANILQQVSKQQGMK